MHNLVRQTTSTSSRYQTNFSYAEIKHSDWLKIAIRLATANQIALFHLGIVTLQ